MTNACGEKLSQGIILGALGLALASCLDTSGLGGVVRDASGEHGPGSVAYDGGGAKAVDAAKDGPSGTGGTRTFLDGGLPSSGGAPGAASGGGGVPASAGSGGTVVAPPGGAVSPTGGSPGSGGLSASGGRRAGGGGGSGGSAGGGAVGRGGSRGGGATGADAGADVPGSGLACGFATCGPGELCCSPSCGLCTRQGAACIELVCSDGGGITSDAGGCTALPASDDRFCGGRRPAHAYLCVLSSLSPPCEQARSSQLTGLYCCP